MALWCKVLVLSLGIGVGVGKNLPDSASLSKYIAREKQDVLHQTKWFSWINRTSRTTIFSRSAPNTIRKYTIILKDVALTFSLIIEMVHLLFKCISSCFRLAAHNIVLIILTVRYHNLLVLPHIYLLNLLSVEIIWIVAIMRKCKDRC